MPGTIYLVGTPIGNLEDITLRALRVLREADLIACEDTRRSRKLLDHFEIRKPLLSYHEHNEEASAKGLAARAQTGDNIAVITDAGMPGISDPGFRLVQEAIHAGITIVPIPGPVALETALVASGLPTDSFRFWGFLPRAQITAGEGAGRIRRRDSDARFLRSAPQDRSNTGRHCQNPGRPARCRRP